MGVTLCRSGRPRGHVAGVAVAVAIAVTLIIHGQHCHGRSAQTKLREGMLSKLCRRELTARGWWTSTIMATAMATGPFGLQHLNAGGLAERAI